MAIGLTVTKPFAEKCRLLCTYAYRHVYACKRNGRFYTKKQQLDALIQFANIFVDVKGIYSWSISVNLMEIKPTVFMQQVLELS